jgi:hypothetical protein
VKESLGQMLPPAMVDKNKNFKARLPKSLVYDLGFPEISEPHVPYL